MTDRYDNENHDDSGFIPKKNQVEDIRTIFQYGTCFRDFVLHWRTVYESLPYLMDSLDKQLGSGATSRVLKARRLDSGRFVLWFVMGWSWTYTMCYVLINVLCALCIDSKSDWLPSKKLKNQSRITSPLRRNVNYYESWDLFFTLNVGTNLDVRRAHFSTDSVIRIFSNTVIATKMTNGIKYRI